MSKKITVTAALPYANGPLHLGHVAGVYLPADIYVRYLRAAGKDVAYICGSDEHGAAITLRAKKEGVTPKEIVDKYHKMNQKAFADLGISFDIYHRTSTPLHHETAQEVFRTLDEKGRFIQETSEQYYDEEHKQFLADRYVKGTCPKCGYEDAYGDQCEKCGSTLSPLELINPKSTLSDKTPVLKETSHWYFPLNEQEDWLREWVKNGTLEGKPHHDPKTWRNQVIGQCLSWIDGGLKPRAMTRDLDWGVPVPVEGADGKVLYVWMDAPIGYISATKQWAEDTGRDWEEYWKGDAELIHFIGKDNIVFHAIIFPSILKELGDYVLPQNVPASEFLNLEGGKFSTSRNWAVWLHEYMDRHPGRVDELRYVLCSISPENQDSEFTWADFQARVNNELADILGNFMNRAVVLNHKYYGGKVPPRGELTAEDQEMIKHLEEAPKIVAEKLGQYRFREALMAAMNLAREGNRYLASTEPWKLVKTDAKRVETIMNITAQVGANLGLILEPFMPEAAARIRGSFGNEMTPWEGIGSIDLLPEGRDIEKLDILFTKIDDEWVEGERNLLNQMNQVEMPYPELKQNIQFDDFMKLDLRVAKVLEAEKVKGADKLLQLKVDTGVDQRTVLSGVAEHFAPEEVVGKTVVIVANLAPKKIRGVESQGMILMAEDGEGKLSFIRPEDDITAGWEVR